MSPASNFKSKLQTPAKGIFALENGPHFEGYFFGKKTEAYGEAVFNTGMVGYPETLTDPSYRGQILVLTYPLVGNYGVPADDVVDGLRVHFESNDIHLRGLIVADYTFNYSHYTAVKSLDDWLTECGIPALYGVDTRAVTRYLRERGVCRGGIIAGEKGVTKKMPREAAGTHFVSEVSVTECTEYKKGDTRVLLIDCGVKNNIIRSLLKRDVSVLRVPWDYDFSKETYDAIVISNGPGDPSDCGKTVEHIRRALAEEKPIFGICLGNQILARAAGASTYKLPYGHRGQNQPCIDTRTNRCYITSQNHGYAVDEATLPRAWEVWFKNLNDGTNEGIRHTSKPFFSVQFHPEARPGPTDTDFLFDEFLQHISHAKNKKI